MEDLSLEEFLDGFALWEEHMPQTGEDWVAVAERFIAGDGDTSKSSALFTALVLAVRQRDTLRSKLEAEVERLRKSAQPRRGPEGRAIAVAELLCSGWTGGAVSAMLEVTDRGGSMQEALAAAEKAQSLPGSRLDELAQRAGGETNG